MQAKDIILSGVVGLDLSEASNAVFVAETTKDIANLDMFIDYCRDQKEGITYTTKTERLDILANRFKKLEEAERLKNRHDDGELSVSKLVSLIGDCKTFVKDARGNGEPVEFKHIRLEGTPVFTLKQLEALREVGSTDFIIHQHEVHKLQDELMQIYMAKFKSKAAYKSLGTGAKKVMSLVSMSAEKMEG